MLNSWTITVPNPAIIVNDTTKICSSDSVLFRGRYVKGYRTHRDTNCAKVGIHADSIFNLVVLPASQKIEHRKDTLCYGRTYFFEDGDSSRVSGKDTAYVSLSAGCDSVYIVDLKILDPPKTTASPVFICPGDFHIFPDGDTGRTRQWDTTFFTNSQGCDSLLLTYLAIRPLDTNEKKVSICQGDTYYFPNGDSSQVNVIDTTLLTDKFGCDSLVITDLKVYPNYANVQSDTICEGMTFYFPDWTQSKVSKTHTSQLTSSRGCDSVIVSHLYVTPAPLYKEKDTICQGQVFIFPDSTQSQVAQTHTSLLNAQGCDYKIESQLTVTAAPITHRKDTICQGKIFTFPDGSTSSTSQLDTSIVSTSLGCDSVIYTELTVAPPTGQYQYHTICWGQVFTFRDGDTSSISKVDSNLLTQPRSCDQLILDSLYVFPLSLTKDTAYTCVGTPHTFYDGFSFAYDTVYRSYFTNKMGCDSILETQLITHPDYSVRVYDTVCQGQVYTFPDGSTTTSSTFHASQLQSQYGCDSLVSTLLTFKQADTSVVQNTSVLTAVNQSAQSYTWIDCQSGQMVSGQNTAQFSASQNGSYALIIEDNGCVDTSSCYTISSLQLGVYDPNTIEKLVRIYPNPTSGEFVLELNEEGKVYQVMIADAQGKLVWEQRNLTDSKQFIDLTAEPEGTYFISIQLDGQEQVFRLVKTR
ncbi:T9SS type A sorting domain-containing protein [bacterium SCSIO 12741]|nr:T9SS type A sorting domain-containing protein [bacterium SCSIO 12741]